MIKKMMRAAAAALFGFVGVAKAIPYTYTGEPFAGANSGDPTQHITISFDENFAPNLVNQTVTITSPIRATGDGLDLMTGIDGVVAYTPPTVTVTTDATGLALDFLAYSIDVRKPGYNYITIFNNGALAQDSVLAPPYLGGAKISSVAGSWSPLASTPGAAGVPEIDAASGTGALTLLGGALVLANERRRRSYPANNNG